jgi:endonuclease-3
MTHQLIRLLSNHYGTPSERSRRPPLDVLVSTILSQNTSDTNSRPAFRNLKEKFKTWEEVERARVSQIEKAIRRGGLGNIKAKRIKEVLKEIRRREGKISLGRLKKLSDTEGFDYLRTLKGVGEKTAACVLLFSLRRNILPVDTHILRVSKRLGLIHPKTTLKDAHGLLGKIIPKKDVYPFHLNLIRHGREICHARNPSCSTCFLNRICPKVGVYPFPHIARGFTRM